MFTETHLNQNISDAEITMPGFNIIRADRKDRYRGGTCIYINENLPYTQLMSWSNSICEICAIEVQETILICIYRPPDCRNHEFHEAIKELEDLLERNDDKDIVIAGDFNFPNIRWKETNPPCLSAEEGSLNSQSKKLLEVLEDNSIFQFVKQKTRQQTH